MVSIFQEKDGIKSAYPWVINDMANNSNKIQGSPEGSKKDLDNSNTSSKGSQNSSLWLIQENSQRERFNSIEM